MKNVIPSYTMWAKLIREFEGFRLNAYLDSGKIATIGFGSTYHHTLKRRVKMGDVITYETALRWMQIDFQETVRLANVYIKKPLSQRQSTAICDYIYNRGIGNFLKTQLDELINANPDDQRIAAEIKGTGLKDRLGNILNGLIRRRRCQAHLYFTGVIKFQF